METTETIAVYGKSGHGRVVAQIAAALGYTEILWIDDAAEGAASLERFLSETDGVPVALGIGSNAARQNVYEKLEKAGIEPVTLVHPSAVIADDVGIGAGTVVMPLATVNAGARLGSGVIVNTHAVVEHDCVLEDFVHISPSAALAGAVRVGRRSHVGIGASVIQCLSIGDDTVVGAGAAVVNDLPSRVLAAGVPAVVKKEWK